MSKIELIMPPFIKLFLLIILMKKAIAAEQNNYIDIFKDTLVEYNIIYDRLEIFKSGAICIPYDNNKILDKYAVGFSHNIYEKHIADKIALEGCKIMKKN